MPPKEKKTPEPKAAAGAKVEKKKPEGKKVSKPVATGGKGKNPTLRKVVTKKKKKVHTTVHFRRPKTRLYEKNPKYPRGTSNPLKVMDKFRIIRYPVTTESAMKKIEENNTLVFIVDLFANKNQIRNAVNKMYEIKVKRVNTLIRPDGLKKAMVKLDEKFDALDIANKIGIL